MLRATLALGLLTTPCLAEITVLDAQLVAAFPNAKAAALYLTVESDLPDMLIGAHSDAAMTMLHETVDDGGVMKMQDAGEVIVAPGAPVKLMPGGLHIMLMGLDPQMLEAETMPVTLIFRDAGEVTVDAAVRIGMAEMGDHDEGGHDHGGKGQAGHDHGEGMTE